MERSRGKKKVHSLWLSRKKGDRESSSGSGEERQGARMCSAPVRRRNEGREGGRKAGRKEGRKGGRGNCEGNKKVAEELRKEGIKLHSD